MFYVGFQCHDCKTTETPCLIVGIAGDEQRYYCMECINGIYEDLKEQGSFEPRPHLVRVK